MTKKEQRKIKYSSFCRTSPDFWEKFLYQVPNLAGEEWRTIPDWCGYQASNYGRIKRTRQERFYKGKVYFFAEKLIKPYFDKKGYAQVTLKQFGRRGTFYVHRLVADAFDLPYNSPDDVFVNHKDQTPSNNKLENLERATITYNNNYSDRNKRLSQSTKERFAKMTKAERMAFSRRASEKTEKKIVCGDTVYKSLTEFCQTWKLKISTVCHWLNGRNAMPQEWREKGLKYI